MSSFQISNIKAYASSNQRGKITEEVNDHHRMYYINGDKFVSAINLIICFEN